MNTENTMAGDKSSPLFTIPGLDARRGIAMTGGKEEGYRVILSIFCKDANDRLSLLEGPPKPEALLTFITHVHALKSASGSIGAADVSALAAELENAGRAEDLALIQDKLPVFTELLGELVKNIKACLDKNEESERGNKVSSGSSFFIAHSSLLNDLAKALESQKVNEINRVLQEITDISSREPMDSISKDAFEQISDEVMMVEYDNAKKILEELLAVNNDG